MPAALTFFFDFISPYAFIAWKALPVIAARHGRTIDPVPILFAALLNRHGQKGPAEIPAKRVYTFKDATRKAAKAGLGELVPPPSHPFNPLLALRVASLPMDAGARTRLIDALHDAVWTGGGGVETPAAVAACANRAGLDGEALVAAAGAEDSKARLRSATERALGLDVFGVPTVIADGELFWGVDALGHLDDFLAGHDPVPPDLFERWGALGASAHRIEP